MDLNLDPTWNLDLDMTSNPGSDFRTWIWNLDLEPGSGNLNLEPGSGIWILKFEPGAWILKLELESGFEVGTWNLDLRSGSLESGY